MRENVSSYTLATIIPDEKSISIRDGLVRLCSLYGHNTECPIAVRTDPAPAFRSLSTDRILTSKNITVVLGHEKNVNKNPIAERAISELHECLRRTQSKSGPVTETELIAVVGDLNNKLRLGGLSSSEIWTQRCQFTRKPLPINDKELISEKLSHRVSDHPASAKYKARGAKSKRTPNINIGSLVYLYVDGTKLARRDRYIVVSRDGEHFMVQKFVSNQLRGRR
jgi:hypothetical protein